MDLHWYAVYTRPRSERKVLSLLEENKVESYLPLIRELRQWSDRKKWVEKPLFSSYVFVRILPNQDLKIRMIDGVIRFVTFAGEMVVIPDSQIQDVKNLLASEVPFAVEKYTFKPGDLVEVVHGRLKGMRGIFEYLQGSSRIMVSFEKLGYNLCVNISRNHVKPVKSK
ncbi:MAG: UpxY family transcription antiterminator [Bacteroidetes bacterium]|nr:UpxY family transcription antiterminator [Bacteroidota bacterium]